MKGLLRYLASLLAILCMLGSALLALFCCATTERFALEVGDTRTLLALQQQRIDKAAEELAARWGLPDDLLSPWTEGAARQQSRAVAGWWGDLWSDPDADAVMPAWLDAQQEAALVAAVRADTGFIALTDENQRRAIARDEVAYAIDVAVCEAVVPLRRSVTELALTALQEAAPLPRIRQAALIGAGALAVLAVGLMLASRRAAGSTLLAGVVTMVLASVPVILADIPGMLRQLSDIAPLQAENALVCLALLWYGAAGALVVLGLLTIAVKKAVGRDGE